MSRFPRYFRSRSTRCVYTNDWHFYLFPRSERGTRTDRGFTIKHRRRDWLWRHWTLRLTTRRMDQLLVTLEAVTHLSRSANGDRVTRSKRYLRFKACLPVAGSHG